MHTIKDKNGVSFNLVPGSKLTGQNRVFVVIAFTRLAGVKIEYSLQEIILPEGCYKRAVEDSEFLNRIIHSCQKRLIEIPAAVVEQQFENGLLQHL